VEKYGIARQATDENIIQRMRIAGLDTQGYKRTLRTRNAFWFSDATKVMRARLNVTLYMKIM
jgi:hypothetical protein